MMRLTPRDATPHQASESIDAAYPPLSDKHAVFDARKRARSDTVTATSKRPRVAPESSQKDEAKGVDKGVKSKGQGESDKKRSKHLGHALATSVIKNNSAKKENTFKPFSASRENRVSFQAPGVSEPNVEKSLEARKKEDIPVLKVDAHFSDDTDKENEEDEATENEDSDCNSRRMSDDSDEEMSQSTSFSDEGTSQLTSFSDETSDISPSEMDFWDRVAGECDCRSCRWHRDGFDSEDYMLDEDERPAPVPHKLNTVHAARLVAHQHQKGVSPQPVLQRAEGSSPASSSTLQEMSSGRFVGEKAGDTGMDVDKPASGQYKGVERNNIEMDAEEAQNANDHIVDKGKGKDPAYNLGNAVLGTNGNVGLAVNGKVDQSREADDIEAVAKESQEAPTKSGGKTSATEPTATNPKTLKEAEMPKEILQLLTALVQQECAKAIPKTSGIDDLSDQIAGVFSEVHKVFHMVDENLAETYKLRRKVKTMNESLAYVQERTDNANDLLESIQQDIAKYKRRRRTSTESSQEDKAKGESSQLKHLDNAVLSIEAKLSALGMFLTGKVVRDVASVEENGLKKLFDGVTEDIASIGALIEKAIESVDGISAAVDGMEARMAEMDDEIGSSGDVDSTLHGRLTSIESRLEANFKY